jgi:hypothetical protein
VNTVNRDRKSSNPEILNRSARDLAADETVKPLAEHGGERVEQVANSHLSKPTNKPSSDSAERIVRRLKRDAPGSCARR